MAIQGFFTGDVKIRDLNGVLKAVDGIVEVATDAGTVTSVGLTVGSTGTDVNVANSPITSSGNITLNLPTASATNRGLLSSVDWTTFNNKQAAGNYVTLDTYQTITASKTFSVGFNLASVGGTNQPTFFENTNNLHSGSVGSNIFGFNTANNIYFGKGSDNGGVLQWNNSEVRYYTLPNANGTIALVGGAGVGTVTSVAALTLGTSGTDLSSTVANSTTTPVITLNVPTASGTNRGALSSADWTTFNSKQGAITLTTTGSSGAATLIGTTLNIPNYTPDLSGYVPTSRQLTINGTTYDLSANRSWSVGTVTSVGITMPSAFAVSSSPVTGSGTISVTGAGLASQYVRGDGTLGDFPGGGGGGGASVAYYLNGSVNQGTFGGTTYYEMNKTPIIGAGTDFTINTNGYIASFLTDAGDPALLNIPGGNWNLELYFSSSSSGGSPSFYVELYKYDGTTFTLLASNSASPEGITNGTTIDLYFTAISVPTTTLAITDRLAIRIYVNNSGRTITLHTENSHLCEVITTFSTGLTALNGLTAQVQYLTTGTSGTDFNIASATATHTFNLPTASATNRGALSSADWTTFNNKQNALTNPITGTGTSGQVAYFNGTNSITSNAAFAFTPTSQLLVNNSVTAASAIARGTNLTPTLVAAANNDVLVGLDINPTFSNGAFTGVQNIGLRVQNGYISGTTSTLGNMFVLNGANSTLFSVVSQASAPVGSIALNMSVNPSASSLEGAYMNLTGYYESWINVIANKASAGNKYWRFGNLGNSNYYAIQKLTDTGSAISFTALAAFSSTGNIGINTTTDSGFKLDVNGTARVQTAFTIDGTSGGNLNIRNNNTNDWNVGENSGEATRNFNFYNFNTSSINLSINRTSGNLLLNTTTDAGFRLDVNGTARVQGAFTITGSTTAASAIARGANFTSTLVAAANNDVLVGLDINPTFTNGAFTGVQNIAARITGQLLLNNSSSNPQIIVESNRGTGASSFVGINFRNTNATSNKSQFTFGGGTVASGESRTFSLGTDINGTGVKDLYIYNGGTGNSPLIITPNDRVIIGNSGISYSDGGFRLDVNGTARVQDILTVSKNHNGTTNVIASNSTSGNLSIVEFRALSTNGLLTVGKYSATTNAYKIINSNDGFLYNNTSGDIAILNDFATGSIKFSANGSSTAQATLFSTGNFALNTTTDAGFKLDVNGTARVQDLVHLNNASGGQIRMWTSTANNSGIYGISSSATGIYGNAHIQFDLFVRSTGSGIKKVGQSSLGNTNNICITNNNTSLEPIMITTTDSGAVGIMKSTSTIPASAVFEIESTTKGFLPPRGTNAQRNAIASPAIGLVFYCTDSVEGLYIYTATGWRSLAMV